MPETFDINAPLSFGSDDAIIPQPPNANPEPAPTDEPQPFGETLEQPPAPDDGEEDGQPKPFDINTPLDFANSAVGDMTGLDKKGKEIPQTWSQWAEEQPDKWKGSAGHGVRTLWKAVDNFTMGTTPYMAAALETTMEAILPKWVTDYVNTKAEQDSRGWQQNLRVQKQMAGIMTEEFNEDAGLASKGVALAGSLAGFGKISSSIGVLKNVEKASKLKGAAMWKQLGLGSAKEVAAHTAIRAFKEYSDEDGDPERVFNGVSMALDAAGPLLPHFVGSLYGKFGKAKVDEHLPEIIKQFHGGAAGLSAAITKTFGGSHKAMDKLIEESSKALRKDAQDFLDLEVQRAAARTGGQTAGERYSTIATSQKNHDTNIGADLKAMAQQNREGFSNNQAFGRADDVVPNGTRDPVREAGQHFDELERAFADAPDYVMPAKFMKSAAPMVRQLVARHADPGKNPTATDDILATIGGKIAAQTKARSNYRQEIKNVLKSTNRVPSTPISQRGSPKPKDVTMSAHEAFILRQHLKKKLRNTSEAVRGTLKGQTSLLRDLDTMLEQHAAAKGIDMKQLSTAYKQEKVLQKARKRVTESVSGAEVEAGAKFRKGIVKGDHKMLENFSKVNEGWTRKAAREIVAQEFSRISKQGQPEDVIKAYDGIFNGGHITDRVLAQAYSPRAVAHMKKAFEEIKAFESRVTKMREDLEGGKRIFQAASSNKTAFGIHAAAFATGVMSMGSGMFMLHAATTFVPSLLANFLAKSPGKATQYIARLDRALGLVGGRRPTGKETAVMLNNILRDLNDDPETSQAFQKGMAELKRLRLNGSASR